MGKPVKLELAVIIMLICLMNLNLTNLLMPIFRMIASPGLGNPHSPHETSLMVKGIKPVAIMDSRDIENATSLQDGINNGSILQIGEYDFEQKYRIYCRESEIENAQKAAGILTKSLHHVKYLSPNDHVELKKNFDIENDVMTGLARSFQHVKDFYFSTIEGYKTPETQALLDGTSDILLPIQITTEDKLDVDLEDQVEKNMLTAVDFSRVNTICVIAQKDKKEDGRELYARCYHNNEGYDDLRGDELNARIGTLLGYTANDIAWSNGTKYQNSWVMKLMYDTMDFRRKIRHKVTLHDAAPRPQNL